MKITDAAAWKKPTKNGGTYLSVRVTFEDGSNAWVNLFDNRYKEKENQPDMKVIKDKPQQGVQTSAHPLGLNESDEQAAMAAIFDKDDKIPF